MTFSSYHSGLRRKLMSVESMRLVVVPLVVAVLLMKSSGSGAISRRMAARSVGRVVPTAIQLRYRRLQLDLFCASRVLGALRKVIAEPGRRAGSVGEVLAAELAAHDMRRSGLASQGARLILHRDGDGDSHGLSRLRLSAAHALSRHLVVKANGIGDPLGQVDGRLVGGLQLGLAALRQRETAQGFLPAHTEDRHAV